MNNRSEGQRSRSQGQKCNNKKHIYGDRTKTDETIVTKLGTDIVHHDTSPTNITDADDCYTHATTVGVSN